MIEKKLSDTEVHELLHAALLALGSKRAENKTADEAITTARASLELLQFSVLKDEQEREQR